MNQLQKARAEWASLTQRARGISQHSAFREGIYDMGGVSLGIGAWALVTGVAMVKSGMSIPMALLMSFTVYAGSAQLAVLPLMVAGAPLWVIWFTAACVNLRFVILSSMWRGFFAHLALRHRLAISYFSGDVIFVAFLKRYPDAQREPDQLSDFWGAAATNWLVWQGFSVLGIILADQVPLSWGLGFAGVLALLGVLYSMLTDRTTWAATGVAAAVAVAAFALPLKLNILAAIAAAVAVGLLLETSERRLHAWRAGPATLRAPDPARGERHPVLPLDEEQGR